MRRRLILILLIGLITTLTPPANAALVGCPSTWKEPIANQGSTEGIPLDLYALKQEKPFDVIITRLSDEYFVEGSNWLKVGTDHSILTPLSYAFAGKKIRQSWRVEVRGCADIVTRYYEYSLAELKDPIADKDISIFFNDQANRENFGGPKDFQKYSELIQSLDKCKLEIIENAKTYYSQIGSQIVWRDGFQTSAGNCGVVQTISPRIKLFFKNTNCPRVDNGAFRIANGEKCEVFLGMTYFPLFSLSYVNFISFSSFYIEGPVDQTPALQKAASEKATIEARKAPGSPFSLLVTDFGELAKSITEEVIPKVNSDKTLRNMANALRTQVINTRDQMGSLISSPYPNETFELMLKQYRTKLDDLFRQKLNIEVAATNITTITCVKGKTQKKVTGFKPSCPSGYRKK